MFLSRRHYVLKLLHLMGFLTDIGLGYVGQLEPKRRNEMLKDTVFPALNTLKGEVIQHYECDGQNLLFIPRD